MWVIAGLHQVHVAQLAPRFHAIVAAHAAQPERQAAWRAWCDGPELVPGYFPDPQPGHPNMVGPLPATAAFNALACDMPFSSPDAMDLDLMRGDLYDDAVKPVCVLVRKGSPVAALFHGVGPGRSRLIPGWFGNFVLTPKEVRDTRSQLEEALTIPPAERTEVLVRIRAWLSGMGDSGDKDAEELLIGPLRCWIEAVEVGLGLCGSQTWV